MKSFLAAFILIFNLSFFAKAEDLNEFEIEGMSIGNSLLDYFTEEQIKNSETNSTNMDNKFIIIFSPGQAEIYDEIQITYKINDKKYIIHSLDGKLLFDNDINQCKKKLKEIVREVKNMFVDVKIIESENKKHDYDESGKTTTSGSYFLFKSNNYADIYCTDWSDEFFEKEGWVDDLTVTLGSSEYRDFLIEYYR